MKTERFVWAWLLPVTFAAHVTEEYFAPGGFPQWLSRLIGVEFRPDRLVPLLAIAATGFMITLVAAFWGRGWPLVVVATLVLVNGGLHTAASLFTLSYSPGLITGLILWIPLGVSALRWCRSRVPAFEVAVWAGVVAHGLVTLAAVSIVGR